MMENSRAYRNNHKPGSYTHIQQIWAQEQKQEGFQSAPGYIPKFKDPETFIADKIKMLADDFYIYATEDEIKQLRQYTTEADINAAVRTIINNHWR